MHYRVTLTPSFKKRLAKKTPSQRGAILRCVERLGDDPRHHGLRTARIRGTPATWEARVDRSNRVSWEYGAHDEIVVVNHCSHEDVLP
jgi:mRNA-degrading endonuclease RelE of RelBE toxin-antitoxin system